MGKLRGVQLSLEWPRFDALLGRHLCRRCWDGFHSTGNIQRCEGGGCECPCSAKIGQHKPKYTAGLQIPIDVPAIEVTPGS